MAQVPCRIPVDLATADQALRELGDLRRALETILRDAERRARRIEARAEARARPLRARLRALESGLEAFAAANPQLFGSRGRLDLPAGRLGIRRWRTLRPLPGQTWAEVNARLAGAGLGRGAWPPAGANPEVLAGLPAERLCSLGLAAVDCQTFWCSPRPLRQDKG